MADLAALFSASLDPSTRKQAELALTQASLQQNFALEVLALSLSSTQDRAIRLASGIYFKNTIKRRWSPVSSFVASIFDKASSAVPLFL
jgi:exportin-2 (importin alpha re-exporter)